MRRVARRGLHRGDHAEVVVRPQVADPGQRAADAVAARHRVAARSRKVSMPAKVFIGLLMPVAPSVRAGRMPRQHLAAERRVARLLHVDAADLVAPHHEAGGAAHPRHLGHRADGQAVVGAARPRGLVGAQRAELRRAAAGSPRG